MADDALLARWCRYLNLDAERLKLGVGSSDAPNPDARFREIDMEQAALRAAIGEDRFGELTRGLAMGGRAKPNWAVYVGGPFDGTRVVLPPWQTQGTETRFVPAGTPGRLVPHRYEVTDERRKGGFHEGTARVLKYVGPLAEMPAPPPSDLRSMVAYCPPRNPTEP